MAYSIQKLKTISHKISGILYLLEYSKIGISVSLLHNQITVLWELKKFCHVTIFIPMG